MTNYRHIIHAQALQSRLDDPDWRILDCRSDLGDPHAGLRAYRQGHVPGALFVDLEDDLSGKIRDHTGRHPLPEVANIERRLGALGIDSKITVVVYDADSGALASRAWWTLRWLGHQSVFLLNGGIDEWQRCGFGLSAAEESVAARDFQARPRNEMVLTTREIAERSQEVRALNLYDARETGRFLGEFEPIDPVAGHIPGARNLPLTESLQDDLTWKTCGELEAIWEQRLGTDRQVDWAVMCGSGVTACHLAISGLEAGYREPRVYVGSWSEWIRNAERPIALGEGADGA
jgi:thiosulfate/3-mercaptopyruvate sulfurtransferase